MGKEWGGRTHEFPLFFFFFFDLETVSLCGYEPYPGLDKQLIATYATYDSANLKQIIITNISQENSVTYQPPNVPICIHACGLGEGESKK